MQNQRRSFRYPIPAEDWSFQVIRTILPVTDPDEIMVSESMSWLNPGGWELAECSVQIPDICRPVFQSPTIEPDFIA
jgi:hypothetical protein